MVQKQDYVRVTGTSASSRRTPRELDLVADGDEIGFSVHQPDGSQPVLWASREALEEAFSAWKGLPESDEIAVPARTVRKEEQVSFVFDESDEMEVRACWRIRVGKQDLRAALAELGLRAPW